MKRKRSSSDGWLMLIAVAHLAKGLVLCAVTFGAISLFHKDVSAHVERWIDMFRLDPENRYIGALLGKMDVIHTKQLKEISALTGVYAALFITQGVGLGLRQRWAEWLTVIATSLFVPLEIYEIAREFTIVRCLLLGTNLAVVAFLIWLIRQRK